MRAWRFGTPVGLDRERADKLFDAFYTTKSGGMGIGLRHLLVFGPRAPDRVMRGL